MLKKVTLLVAIGLSFFVTNTATAQIEQGQSLLSAGLGLSSFQTTAGYVSAFPPAQLSYEYMISESISVGGIGGVYVTELSTLKSAQKYTYLNFGGLVNYHFVNDETFDVYIGGLLGYSHQSVEGSDVSVSGFLPGIQFGARYFFSEAFAVNTELGYGISLFQVGLTLKL